MLETTLNAKATCMAVSQNIQPRWLVLNKKTIRYEINTVPKLLKHALKN